MAILIRTAILALALLPQLVAAQETGATKEAECDRTYQGKLLASETLQHVIKRHQRWVQRYPAGSGAATIWESREGFKHPLRANLCGAILASVNLSGEKLERANLSEVILKRADLSKADLWQADLSGADLRRANLSRADLRHANLSGANLGEADLSNANLWQADLSGAILNRTKLYGAKYEPEGGKQPVIDAIATAEGLSTLRYDQPRALVKLRKEFIDAGYREQYREITYALRHSQTEEQLNSEAVFGKLEGIFSYIFFEATTKWGMDPGRALILMITLIPVFALPYIVALWAPKDDGIWRFWSGERAREDLGSDKPELVTARGLSGIGYAVYFSLLSASHMGWKDLNVGNWIARIQPREYTLRASGWVRTVAGIQSLISVYLLAIWALTYFGRPFE